MRMVHAINENTTEGAQQVQQTGVGGDAKIVYALLTGMVSDKVVYPVREYATNAWEVSPAGKPFELELPTKFNPQYRIRDFGPGISHRFAMKSYAKIGESTKDGDDDAVGGWGFGSKAALAYLMRSDGAGSFTVVSRHRGFRRVYIIGVNATGKIEIQFMGEWPLEPEDRGTGLEVSFAVREADIQRFHDHAKAVLWSFHPRPVISPAIDFGTPKVLHSGDGWTIYEGAYRSSFGNDRPSSVPFSGPQVKLGPVMYPIDPDLMPYTDMIDEKTCIVFEAKIGTISVSASRENLQYDDRTEAGLRALFDHYHDDWMAKAKATIDAEPDYFKARWKAEDISRTLPGDGWYTLRGLGWRGYEFGDDLFPNQGRVKAACWPEARGKNFHPDMPVSFKADWKINPGELQGRTIVIQHNSSRSKERLQAAGLWDTSCLWVRCSRLDLPYALERMGNPTGYVVLDDVKLPKVAAGVRIKRPENLKRRRFLEHDPATTFTKIADLDEELVFVRAEGRGRRREIETYIDGKRLTWSASSAHSVMKDCIKQGVLARELDILVLDTDEAPRGHWIELGDHLAENIDAMMDESKLSPVIPWGPKSFPDRLRDIAEWKIDLGMAPQEVRDVHYETVAMLKTRQAMTTEPNEHDKLAALYLQLTGRDLKKVSNDPTQPLRDRWYALVAQYPLLEMLIRAGKPEYIYSDTKRAFKADAQRNFDHYFSLFAK